MERRAVRALLLRNREEILLLRIQDPAGGYFWIAPGGGLEEGEDAEAGLRRELFEELGLTDVDIGPVVWRRYHTFTWGERRISQREEYRIVETERFEAVVLDPREAADVESVRWWKIDELASADERVTPLSLRAIVVTYLREGAPDPIPPEEVLFD